MSNQNLTTAFDIVIIGAGPVGVSTALACKKLDANLSIAVIEQNSDLLQSFDNRVLALNLSSMSFFEKIGLAEPIKQAAAEIKTIKVSKHVSNFNNTGWFDDEIINLEKSSNTQEPDSNTDSVSNQALSYAIKAKDLGNILVNELLSNGNPSNNSACQLFLNTSFLGFDNVDNIDNSTNQTLINFQQAENRIQLAAKLVLAADGINSKVREFLGFYKQQRAYSGFLALANTTATLNSQLLGQNESYSVAYEHFGKYGPLALLPIKRSLDSKLALNEAEFKLVYSISEKQFNQIKNLAETEQQKYILDDFIQAFHNNGSLDRAELKLNTIDDLVFFPAKQTTINKLFHNNIVLLGNAAHGLHPVAAQGLNLGIRDIDKLIAMTFASHLIDNNQPSIIENKQLLLQQLNIYQNQRLAEYEKVHLFTHSLIDIFAENTTTINKIINFLGYKLIAKSTTLQNKLINFGSYG